MEQIKTFFNNITAVEIADIWIAVAIILFFIIFSSGISYAIVKMFKFKESPKRIKESAFYNPLRLFFIILGFYLAILFLKQPLSISQELWNIVTLVFEIIIVIAFARGLAQSFRPNSTLIKKVENSIKKKEKKLDENAFSFLLKIVRVLIYLIAAFIVLSLLGINLNGLIAGIGLGGVIITLAAQDTAKNLFGGLVIFLDRPFIVGDWIQTGNYEGTVEDITFRTTRIRTFENSLVNVPNSVISESSIINWSKMEKRRYRMNLCLELDTPMEKIQKFEKRVEEMLAERDTINDDFIEVKLDAITSNGLDILIYAYTDSINYESYLAECEVINCKILKILKEENIELAYDTKSVYLKNTK